MAPTLAALRADESVRGKVSDAEWQGRVNLAAAFRVGTHLGWNFGNRNHMTLRIADQPGNFLMNAANFGWHEITASNLLKIDRDGNILTETHLSPGPAGLNFHGALLRSNPKLASTMHVHAKDGVVVSAMQEGLMFFDQTSCSVYGQLAYHDFQGLADDKEEGPQILEELGDKYTMIMRNHGLLSVGRTLGEAFMYMAGLVSACETQVRLMSTGTKLRPLPKEICEHTAAQLQDRQKGRPRGEIEWKMYLRLAERLDPSFKT